MDWQHNPISQALKAPEAASEPTCYAWVRDHTQHIVYRSADGQIHELWLRKGQSWQYGGALTKTTNAPEADGDPCGYVWEFDGTQHIIYRGKDKQIHELWQKQGQPWKYGGALTKTAGAPAAAGDPWAYARELDGTQHGVYRADDGQIHELWQKQGQPWKHGGALTQMTGAGQAAGDPTGFAWDDDGTQHVVYRGADNQVHELWQRQGQPWKHGGALSHTLGAPAAAGEPTCYAWTKDGTQHIMYRGTDNQVYELWLRKGEGWKLGGALTQMAKSPPADGSPSGWSWESDASQHVAYRGTDNGIHELWQAQGKSWAYGGSLTQKTKAPAAIGNPDGFAWDDDGTQHVVYLGTDHHIHEFWMRK
jgi:hypothetical protein